MKNKILLVLALLLPLMAIANEGVKLDRAPIDPNNQASLQRGAKTFVRRGMCLGRCAARGALRAGDGGTRHHGVWQC